MSNRRIARRHIAAAHLASTARGARLLSASDGDAQHAERIDLALRELGAPDDRPLAPVVQLPRSFACSIDEAGGARPYDHELEPPSAGWVPAVGLGLAAWAVLAGLAFACYAIAQAFT
jgi:hypothetical protein